MSNINGFEEKWETYYHYSLDVQTGVVPKLATTNVI